jgi:hypothetical protein
MRVQNRLHREAAVTTGDCFALGVLATVLFVTFALNIFDRGHRRK